MPARQGSARHRARPIRNRRQTCRTPSHFGGRAGTPGRPQAADERGVRRPEPAGRHVGRGGRQPCHAAADRRAPAAAPGAPARGRARRAGVPRAAGQRPPALVRPVAHGAGDQARADGPLRRVGDPARTEAGRVARLRVRSGARRRAVPGPLRGVGKLGHQRAAGHLRAGRARHGRVRRAGGRAPPPAGARRARAVCRLRRLRRDGRQRPHGAGDGHRRALRERGQLRAAAPHQPLAGRGVAQLQPAAAGR